MLRHRIGLLLAAALLPLLAACEEKVGAAPRPDAEPAATEKAPSVDPPDTAADTGDAGDPEDAGAAGAASGPPHSPCPSVGGTGPVSVEDIDENPCLLVDPDLLGEFEGPAEVRLAEWDMGGAEPWTVAQMLYEPVGMSGQATIFTYPDVAAAEEQDASRTTETLDEPGLHDTAEEVPDLGDRAVLTTLASDDGTYGNAILTVLFDRYRLQYDIEYGDEDGDTIVDTEIDAQEAQRRSALVKPKVIDNARLVLQRLGY